MKKSSFLLIAALLSLAACSRPQWAEETPDRIQNRDAVLAEAVPMPNKATYQSAYLEATDTARSREVRSKLYLPELSATTPTTQKTDGAAKTFPLIVFSHGLGGSREGYTYLGKYWASQGFAVLHVQHSGSDRHIWMGNALEIYDRVQGAANEREAIDRAYDVRFALDLLLADPRYQNRIDPQRIAIAGHSFGANTALLVSGAKVVREGKPFLLHDPRFKAALLISAPPFYGEEMKPILADIRIPSLHITATKDDIMVPGFGSGAEDRIKVYEAMGGAAKNLVVFKDGSHSMFTDRLGTGGSEINPLVKQATREVSLAFFRAALLQQPLNLSLWQQQHQTLIENLKTSETPSHTLADKS